MGLGDCDPRLGQGDAFGRTDFCPDVGAVNVPTLVVHGSGDKTVPIDAAGRAAGMAISGADLNK